MVRAVEVRETHDRGLGVFALRDFVTGELVLRRRHVPVTQAEVAALSPEQRAHVCQTAASTFAIVEPPACFVNHGCEPNALRRGVRVVAWKPIAAGQEITLDYRLNAISGSAWACRCRSPSCTGVVEGGFFELDDRRQAELLPFAGDFVRREHRRRMTAP